MFLFYLEVGVVLAGIIGLATHSFSLLNLITATSDGMAGMQELAMICISSRWSIRVN